MKSASYVGLEFITLRSGVACCVGWASQAPTLFFLTINLTVCLFLDYLTGLDWGSLMICPFQGIYLVKIKKFFFYSLESVPTWGGEREKWTPHWAGWGYRAWSQGARIMTCARGICLTMWATRASWSVSMYCSSDEIFLLIDWLMEWFYF